MLGDGAGVLGGAGDDRINVATWNSDKATQALAPLRRQRVDCGDGSDTLIADARDEAGAGVRRGARRAEGGHDARALRPRRAGCARRSGGRPVPSSVRYRIVGSEPPRLKPNASPRHEIAWGKPDVQSVKRVSGAIRAKVKLLASVRKALRATKSAHRPQRQRARGRAPRRGRRRRDERGPRRRRAPRGALTADLRRVPCPAWPATAT